MKLLKNSYGKMMILVGLFVLLPLVIIPFDQSQAQYTTAFLIPGCLSIIVGLFVCLFSDRNNQSFFDDDRRKSISLVMFSWLYTFFLGSLPFFIAGKLTFIQSLFESVSGYTTTGLTVVVPEQLGSIFLLHRTLTQYAGGFGLVLMLLTIIKDASATNLFNAEGHSDKLMPSIQKTSRIIFLVYNILIGVGTIGFMILKMSFFDGFCHAVCSLFTGGFSTKNLGIASFNSVPISLFSVVLMILGSINTGVLILIFTGKFKQVRKISEFKVLFIIIGVSTIIGATSCLLFADMDISNSIYMGITNSVSALSTCGNYYTDLSVLPNVFKTVIIICMIIGGCAGSTTGGIKIYRLLIALKAIRYNIKLKVSSNKRVITSSVVDSSGPTIITDDAIKDTFGFLGIYACLLVIGSLLLMFATNCSLSDALFEFSSSLGGVGSSIGLTGPTTGWFVLVVEMIGMILGRLEIIVVFIAIYYLTHPKKRRKI